MMLVAVGSDSFAREQIEEAQVERIHQEEHQEGRQAATFQEGGKVEAEMGDDLEEKEEHPVGSLA